MNKAQFFFLFAAVYLAPRVSEEVAVGMAIMMTVMGFFYLIHGED